VLHAALTISRPTPSDLGFTTGIWVATGAMLLVLGQVTIGMRLRTLQGRARLRQRRMHFWVMTLIAAGGLVHVVLNGPVVHALARMGTA
jgi:hypothetical protein